MPNEATRKRTGRDRRNGSARPAGSHRDRDRCPVCSPQWIVLPCATRTAWFQDNIPIEPIRFISGASPTALLFQIARFDTFVLPEDAQAAFDAASSPKEVFYYDTGHSLNPQAGLDRYAWLAKHIGIDP